LLEKQIARRRAGQTRRHREIVRLTVLMVLLAVAGVARADYAVQVGAFSRPANAERAARQLRAQGYPVMTRPAANGSRPLTAVLVGPFAGRAQARAARDQLRRSHWNGFLRPLGPRHPATAIGPGARRPAPAPGLFQSDGPDPTDGPAAKEEASSRAQSAPGAGAGNTSQGGIGGLFQPAPSSSDQPAADQKDQAGQRMGALFQPARTAPRPPLRPRGFFQSRLAYTYGNPRHWSLFRNTLQMGVEGHSGPKLGWKISGRISYDPVYYNSDFYPAAVKKDQRLDAMFRETYLDVSAGDWDYRLGRQQIVWGEMVGLFFADVVSAKDLRQFVAQDFDMIRIPQWAARAEYFKGDFHGEAIWIPYMTYDDIGKPGADFYPYPMPAPPGYQTVIRDEHKPHGASDGAYGLRLSYLYNGWDMSGFYYNSMDASPTFFRTVVSNPTPTIVYKPDHTRIQQVGATVGKDMGRFVLKGEAVYTHDRYYNVHRLSDSDGVVRQNSLDYVLGVDYPLPHSSRVNVQVYQRWFPNHDPGIIPDRFESGFSLYASTKLMDQKVEPKFLLIHSLNRNGWMMRPRVTWHFATDWETTAGLDIFHGPPTGLFGQYDNADRAYLQLRYVY